MIYELRIYRAMPGKLGPLMKRFRDHTMRIFERHGIANVGYWTNSVGGRNDELWYMVSFESHAQREQAWANFAADEEWREIRAASEQDGALVHHIENRILSPTEWSPKP